MKDLTDEQLIDLISANYFLRNTDAIAELLRRYKERPKLPDGLFCINATKFYMEKNAIFDNNNIGIVTPYNTALENSYNAGMQTIIDKIKLGS